MSFELTPAKPAVLRTKLVEVEPAIPAQVTVTTSLHEALILAAVQGASTGCVPAMFYHGLKDHPLFQDYYAAVQDAIGHGEGYQKRLLSIAAFDETFNELRRKSEEV